MFGTVLSEYQDAVAAIAAIPHAETITVRYFKLSSMT
jgi:hypothetical protein